MSVEQTDSAAEATPVHPPPTRKSAWTTKQKIVRLIWETVGRLFWVLLPGMRSGLIRMFGGEVGSGCRFARSVQITIPWNLKIGNGVIAADEVILYSLGVITLGDGVQLEPRAHLCAGSHDLRDSTFPLTRPPITVGADTVVGIDAYIGPGVTLGKRCTVYHRASVYKNFPEGSMIRGNPAKAE